MKVATENRQQKMARNDTDTLDPRVDCPHDLHYRWKEVSDAHLSQEVTPASSFEFVNLNPEETVDFDGDVENLVRQIRELGLPDRQIRIICNLYHSCNEKGLLTPADIADVAEICNVSQKEVEIVRQKLMRLEPEGIGAFSNDERLLVLVDECFDNQPELKNLAVRYNDMLVRYPVQELAITLDTSERQIRDARTLYCKWKEICGSPAHVGNPGHEQSTLLSSFHAAVEWTDAELRVSICLPGNQILVFAGKPASKCPEGANTLVEAYLETGIEAEQVARRKKSGRGGTFLLSWVKTVYVLVCEQREFFRKGARFMNELSQDDVATMIGRHSSTLSRALDNRAIRTRWGIHEARMFCSSSRGKRAFSTADNTSLSSSSIREHICSLVLEEDWHNPLSDSEIVSLLKSRFAISIARRTVAKYRKQAGIPSRSERLRRYRQLNFKK